MEFLADGTDKSKASSYNVQRHSQASSKYTSKQGKKYIQCKYNPRRKKLSLILSLKE